MAGPELFVITEFDCTKKRLSSRSIVKQRNSYEYGLLIIFGSLGADFTQPLLNSKKFLLWFIGMFSFDFLQKLYDTSTHESQWRSQKFDLGLQLSTFDQKALKFKFLGIRSKSRFYLVHNSLGLWVHIPIASPLTTLSHET